MEIKRRETIWAEMKPDVYGGDSCDKVIPQWNVYAEGDRDSETEKTLKFSARIFPAGTKIIVLEPECPKCGQLREPKFPTPKTAPIYGGPCECGFDWDNWVLDENS